MRLPPPLEFPEDAETARRGGREHSEVLMSDMRGGAATCAAELPTQSAANTPVVALK